MLKSRGMEQKPDNLTDIPERLAPPAASNISMVLNGAGNGLMLGTAPFLFMEMAEGITQNHVKPFKMTSKMRWGSAIGTVIGAIMGAAYGHYESNQINKYRHNLGAEIENLKHENAVLQEKGTRWADKVSKPEETTAITR